MKPFWLLFVFVTCQVHARLPFPNGSKANGLSGTDTQAWTDRVVARSSGDIKHHGKRSDRRVCSMQNYIDATRSASPLAIDSAHFMSSVNESSLSSLQGRTMTLPGTRATRGKMFTFFRGELAAPDFQNILPETPPDEAQTNTSQFEELGDQAVSLGLEGLHGCTTMVIVSRSGVYTGHFWESIGFSVDQKDVKKYGSSIATFQARTINGIVNGDGNRQASLTQVAAKISAGGPVKGFLIIPDEADPDALTEKYEDYQERWRLMRKTVGQLIPDLAEPDAAAPNPAWSTIIYKSDNEDLVDKTAAGKVLFKYDPNHEGKKKAALWVEDNETDRVNDQW